jgi:hypothetical protein
MNYTTTDVQVLSRSVSGDDGILTVGIVSDKVDTYNTWINPEGCDTPPQAVIIDFRHQGINIGAKMLRYYIKYIKTNLDGTFEIQDKPETGFVKTLVGDISVPKTAELYIKDRNGQTVSDGNAYEAVKIGRIMGGSLEFDPSPYPEETRVDQNGRVYYGKWRMLKFTVLDEAPSQDSAFILNQKNFRSANLNQKNIMSYQQNDVVKITYGENESLAVVNEATPNEDGSVKYNCRSAEGEIKEYTETEISEPSHEELKEYTRSMNSKMMDKKREMDESAKTDDSKEDKMDDETERKTDSEEPKNDDEKADKALISKMIEEALTPILKRLDELEKEEDKDKKEDGEIRSAINPALKLIDPIEPKTEPESRGVTPADLSGENKVPKTVDDLIKQKINSKIY